MTSNKMATIKSTKRQPMMYNILHNLELSGYSGFYYQTRISKCEFEFDYIITREDEIILNEWILCICTATENYKTAAEQPVFSGSQIPQISEFGNFVITLNYQK
jgi:hypothetical protein